MGYSAFVKIKVQLFSNCVVLLLHLDANLAYVTLCSIVQPAVVKYELHILHEILYTLILMFSELSFDRTKVHGILHDIGVVRDLELLPVDRIRKNICLLIAIESGEHALSCLLPLVVDWSRLGNLRHLKLTDWLQVFIVVIKLKVASHLWVRPLELLKLLIGHRRVIAAFTQGCEGVAPGDLTLIDDGLHFGHGSLLLRLTIIGLILLPGIAELAATVKQEAENLQPVLLLGVESRVDTLLVFQLEVRSLIEEELNHFKLIVLDCIEYRPLVLRITVIKHCTQVNQLLSRVYVALSDTVIDGGLAILVLTIDIVAPVRGQEGNGLGVTLTTSIEERSLLQRIFFNRIGTHLH